MAVVGAVGRAVCAPAIGVGGVGLAVDEVLVEEVVDRRVERQVLRSPIRPAQVKQCVCLGVLAQRVVDRLAGGVAAVGVSEILVAGGEARALAAVLALQPQAQAVGGLPVEFGVGQVFGRVGQRLSLVIATLLLAVGVGVVGAQFPGWCELPAASQLQATGYRFVDVDLLRAGAVVVARAQWVGDRVAAGDLVLELVVEQRGVGAEAGQTVEIGTDLGTGGRFGV